LEDSRFLARVPSLWRQRKGVAYSSRGASGGIGTLWDEENLDLLQSRVEQHWILTIFLHKNSGDLVNLFNIYVPLHLEAKKEYWETLCSISKEIPLEKFWLGI